MIEITRFINCFTFDDDSLPTLLDKVKTLIPSFEASVIEHREDSSVMDFAIKKLLMINSCISANLEGAMKISRDYGADMQHIIHTYSQLATIIDSEIRFTQEQTLKESVPEESASHGHEDTEAEKTLFQKLHSTYGDTMSVKQLSEFFKVQSRTITNWEKAGYIENISETNEAYKSDGHKKRGKEKRYLTSEIAKIVELQRKFNKLL